MLSSTELRAGKTFQMDGTPYQVVKYEHVKIGRGGATVRVSVRNLKTGANDEKTFSTSQTVEEIITIKRRLQYLYSDGENAVFMDPKTYEQVEVGKNILKSDLLYLKEGDLADLLFWVEGESSSKDKPLGIDLPPKVNLTVAETDPGVKGNSAANIYKPATLENGLVVKVPLFIKAGDKIRVDTRSGEYTERVKS